MQAFCGRLRLKLMLNNKKGRFIAGLLEAIMKTLEISPSLSETHLSVHLQYMQVFLMP